MKDFDNRIMIRNRFTFEMPIIPQKVLISTLHEQFLKRAMEIVENNLTDTDFNIHHFSQNIGVSWAQLFRKIKAKLL